MLTKAPQHYTEFARMLAPISGQRPPQPRPDNGRGFWASWWPVLVAVAVTIVAGALVIAVVFSLMPR
jgi:hypothetical protein